MLKTKWQHGRVLVSSVTSPRDGPGFESWPGPPGVEFACSPRACFGPTLHMGAINCGLAAAGLLVPTRGQVEVSLSMIPNPQ